MNRVLKVVILQHLFYICRYTSSKPTTKPYTLEWPDLIFTLAISKNRPNKVQNKFKKETVYFWKIRYPIKKTLKCWRLM